MGHPPEIPIGGQYTTEIRTEHVYPLSLFAASETLACTEAGLICSTPRGYFTLLNLDHALGSAGVDFVDSGDYIAGKLEQRLGVWRTLSF